MCGSHRSDKAQKVKNKGDKDAQDKSYMSFSFGFQGEEYSDEEAEGAEASLTESTRALQIDSNNVPLEQSKKHSLEFLINSFPLTIAYSTLSLNESLSLPRRELWDIKHQIMSGSEEVGEEKNQEEVMRFMGSDDVIKGVYEGGFKTWECSIDLAAKVVKAKELLEGVALTIVELGCGTSIPMLALFLAILQRNSRQRYRLIVQDYNLSVLQLSSIPNLFLVWSYHTQQEMDPSGWENDGELDASPDKVKLFLDDLERRQITIEGISGAWGGDLSDTIGHNQADLILASETIYESRNLTSFVDVIQSCLKGRALIAAKSVYFGVGGGIEEFTKETRRRQMTDEVIFESAQGVRRTIVEIKKS